MIVLLPDTDADTYALVKSAGDQDAGMHTICHVCKSRDRGTWWGPSTETGLLSNLYMKLNLKLNPRGVNHALEDNDRGPLLTKSTMILGMDVVSLPLLHLVLVLTL